MRVSTASSIRMHSLNIISCFLYNSHTKIVRWISGVLPGVNYPGVYSFFLFGSSKGSSFLCFFLRFRGEMGEGGGGGL